MAGNVNANGTQVPHQRQDPPPNKLLYLSPSYWWAPVVSWHLEQLDLG